MYDIERGPQEDLTDASVVSKLCASIRGGLVDGVMLATPCTSFTTARDRNSQIRSCRRPAGLSGLSARHRRLVEDGNRCAESTAAIMAACGDGGVPCLLETREPLGCS